MAQVVWRAGDRYRGGDAEAGIETRHAFSFSGFYDPDNVGFGLLVACNEERLAPGAGFAEHPHRDVEIVTWVIEGELAHRDSAGHETVVRAGDVQRLGAGSGVRHSERNAGTGELRFVQMWLVPGAFGTEPSYEVVRGIAERTPFALPGTEAVLHVRRPAGEERVAVPDAAFVYLHVVRGRVLLEGTALGEGDAARLTDTSGLVLSAAQDGAELLMWEMHAEPAYG
ncbi:pirin family protein [Streptomyces albus subsp. chlorinus]|uniref:pirin family protein n=1 Tax=Streptomyces albus TaxID=1888 RepID=UPI00156FDE35|nr:pirin-like bicupin family protein [Streptomyces albus]NSC21578.1 pirin family protein [Streptomyces albus subsp. chlorinus]